MNLTEADKRKLRDALAVRTHLNGNLLTFIGLDEIRDRFPQEWNRNRDRILGTARSILGQFTDPAADIVLPRGEAGFIVLFTRLGKDEALLRAAMIKAEILKRFTGDDALDTLDVHVQAMELESGEVMNGALGDLLAKLDPAAGAPTPAAGKPEPKAPARPEQKAYRASLTEIGAQASTPLDELEKRFGYDVDELDFAFQPYLYAPRGVFSVFACKPVRYGAFGDILAGYAVLPREVEPAQVAALDIMTLLRARHGLVDMAVRKRVAMVIVPVSFETMTNRSASAEYVALLQKIPSDLRNYLVISLGRCPVGVPEGRMTEIMTPLKRLARAVCFRVDSPRQSLAAVKSAGAYSVGFNLLHVGPDMATPASVSRFVATARKLGLQTFIDGVNTPEQLRFCREAAPDYLGGRSLAEFSDYVGPITELRAA